MSSIKLPELPKGKEFEEFSSTFFQCNEFYIERNIVDREIEEVLELDIIATNYGGAIPELKLIEVKSGDWGFAEIFKVRGWMDYLSISQGIFIVSSEKTPIDFYRQKAKILNIDLVVIPDPNDAKDALKGIMDCEKIDQVDISAWRFSYWIERNLLKRLKCKKKAEKDKKCFGTLDSYYSQVNNEIFFTESIAKRVEGLYSTFKKYPRISSKCGYESIKSGFDNDCDRLPEDIYAETYYKCKYNAIQISTFIENRARLAILKSAIDYKLYKEAGREDKIENIVNMDDTKWYEVILLPDSFQNGLEEISKHKYYHKYPIFWQWFLWVFGGFILKDYEDREYEILSQKTGIEVNEIPNALNSFQILFPMEGGWFLDLEPSSGSNIKLLKMFSVPFMGIGANYRRWIHTQNQDFEELKLNGENTLKDLTKWNNLLVEVLKG